MKVGGFVKRRAIPATVAVVVATVGWLGASAAADAAGEHTNHTRTITFVDETTASTLVDINQNGTADPGDFLVFHEQYVTKGVRVEYNDSICTVGFEDSYLCHVVVVVVGHGQLVVDGSVLAPGGAFPADFDLPVTGGSGDFASARGYAHVHQVSDTVARDTVVLVP